MSTVYWSSPAGTSLLILLTMFLYVLKQKQLLIRHYIQEASRLIKQSKRYIRRRNNKFTLPLYYAGITVWLISIVTLFIIGFR